MGLKERKGRGDDNAGYPLATVTPYLKPQEGYCQRLASKFRENRAYALGFRPGN